jgi:hypothetical protein
MLKNKQISFFLQSDSGRVVWERVRNSFVSGGSTSGRGDR